MVLPTRALDDEEPELRIAFDFDGVLADGEAERVYAQSGIKGFHASETEKQDIPHRPGPLKTLLEKLARFQGVESAKQREDLEHKRLLRIAVITARNAPSNERFVTTMESWGIRTDETFFLGGIEKKRILDVFRPHIFFDDQAGHLSGAAETTPSVHIPFGAKNAPVESEATMPAVT